MKKYLLIYKFLLAVCVFILCLSSITLLRAEIIFQDSFDSGDFSVWGKKDVGWTGNIEFTPSCAFFDSVAKISYYKNEDRGHLYPLNISRGHNHLYLKWYEYFDEGFDFPLTLKTNMIMGFNPATGLNEWETYIITWGDPNNDNPDEAAQNIGFVLLRAVDKRIDPVSAVSIKTGQWYCIEEEIILNTPGIPDGTLRLWINGKLVIDKVNISIRGNSAMPIGRMWFGGNYSNSNAGRNPTPDPARPSYRYMDDFIITDGERVGTLIKEDINSDGEVNVLDAQSCVNIILGFEAGYNIIKKAKEIVEPLNECDVLDLQAVVNNILQDNFISSPFGILEPYVNSSASEELSDLDVHWARKGGPIMTWDLREPQKGVFDWDYSDKYIKRAQDDGVNLLLTINSKNKWDLESCGKYPIPDTKDCSPCNWDNYKVFLEKIFNRYSKDVKYWQIGNEENHSWVESEADYAKLVKFTCQVLKENCPDCKLLLSGPSNPEGFYSFYIKVLEELDKISLPGEHYFDIFDAHLFGYFGGYKAYSKLANTYEIKKYISDIKVELLKYGYPDEVWMTETAVYSGDPEEKKDLFCPRQSEKEQAIELIKRFVYPLSKGVKKIFWVTLTEWHEFSGDLNGYFDNTGLINNLYNDGDDFKKLSYYTYKLMVEKLKNSDLSRIEIIQEENSIYIYKFPQNNGKDIFVAWWDYFDESDGSETKKIRIKADTAANITESTLDFESGKDIMPNSYPVFLNLQVKPDEEGFINIELKDSPVFIEID